MSNVENYDFRKPQRYSSENIRCINFIAEDFCKKSTIYMNYELKFKSKLEVSNIRQTNYQEFLDDVTPNSVVVQNFIKPMVKNFLLKLDKNTSMMWIDIISGGNGIIKDTNREFTDIDIHLLTHMINNMIKKLYIPSSCECALVENIYTNANMPQFCAPSESVCIIDMSIEIENENAGTISFCAPYSSMEPILEELSEMNLPTDFSLGNSDELKNKIYENVCSSDLTVTGEIGKISININDLLKLEEGDILISNKKMIDNIEVYIEDSKVYTAIPGLIGKKKGLKIVDIM